MKYSNEYSDTKKNGVTFTSAPLANYLATRLALYLTEKNGTLLVNDPACGDGELLLAISKLLKEHGISFRLLGTDTSEQYVNETTDRIKKQYPSIECSIEQLDFVENRIGDLFQENIQKDVIIANPPYVRTQILGADKAQAIAKLYNLKGKIDLYFPFLINMTESLKEGGLIGVITSNRYLTTKSGETIRQYLLKNYDILEIIDLGDTKLFNAAVLPAIFIGRKNTKSPNVGNALFKKIYETSVVNDSDSFTSVESVFSILSADKNGLYKVKDKFYRYTSGFFKRPTIDTGIWQMNTKSENEFVDTINANKFVCVSDIFKVRVGVKSCADEVFFNNSWDELVKPEEVFFRPIISSDNISQWTIDEKLKEVVYPHAEKDGKKYVLDISQYPKARSFFESNKARLSARTYLMKSKKEWYEYWVPQNPTMWKYPKIVFADISTEPRFAIDFSGAIVDGNCYWFAATTKEEENLLYLIVGIANSKTIEKYHDLCFNNKLYNGRRRYLSQYVEKYPLPNPQSKYSVEIIKLVKEIYSTPHSEEELVKIKEKIEKQVVNAFNLGVK